MRGKASIHVQCPKRSNQKKIGRIGKGVKLGGSQFPPMMVPVDALVGGLRRGDAYPPNLCGLDICKA